MTNRITSKLFITACLLSAILNLTLVNAQTPKPQQIIEVGPVAQVRWSPDGAFLAILTTNADRSENNRSVSIWKVTGELTKTFGGDNDSIHAIEWSPDGQMIAALDANYNLLVWEVNNEELVYSFRVEEISGSIARRYDNVLTSLSWNPNETQLAIGNDYYISIVDTTTGSGKTILNSQGNYDLVVDVDWSPNGERLAKIGGFGELTIFDAANFETLVSSPNTSNQPIEYYKTDAQRLVWSPDNAFIAHFGTIMDIKSTSGGDTVTIHKVVSIHDAFTGQVVGILGGQDGNITSITWSPDGGKLASTSEDGTIIIWDAITYQKLITLEGHTDVVSSASWSPDSEFLASGSYDGTVRIWQVE